MKLDGTMFSVTADSLDEAVQFAVTHLQGVVVADGRPGFVAPVLDRESFELIDGKWCRVFRFVSDLLPKAST